MKESGLFLNGTIEEAIQVISDKSVKEVKFLTTEESRNIFIK